MSYTVLARRYRSTTFRGVIGQEPIARTLCNAIERNRVAHAYLFCGTRGVGKTSLARLFARALNAPDTIDDAPRPEGSGDDDYPPLDVQQRMADAIMRGEDLNVIEIDGASSNSVDEARQLIARAGLAPTAQARYKIYIIDEVHMLTTQAFNALLKTMEEPPAHVKFILCTTEPGKIPATIQSRCQRFDFRNIPAARIAEHLRDVLGQEAVEAEDAVIWHVARLGNGSMRDALSLLDRLLATGDNPISAATIEQMFGLPAASLIADLAQAMADGNPGATLSLTGALLDQGIGQEQLIDALTEHLRQLMLLAACGPDTDLVELPAEQRQAMTGQAACFDAAGLTYLIALAENTRQRLRNSASPRALLDASFVRMALSERMADLTRLLEDGEKKK